MDIEKIIQKMTLKEKIEQLSQLQLVFSDFENVKKTVEEKCLGSLILSASAFGGSVAQDKLHNEKLDEIQKIAMEKHGIPLLFGRDVIHGQYITIPVPLALAATFNPELIKEGYRNIAVASRSNGINWSFAPMLDVARDPRWGRVIECPGEDPYLGEKMAEAVITGFQGDDETPYMAACAKHYIGYGASDGGRDYHKCEISDYSLQNYYLQAFRGAANAGVLTVMNSFNEISGVPTASSRYLLTDVLRGQLGFDGFVVSDWGSVEQIERQGVAKDKQMAAALAINAGLEMDMVDECYINHMEKCVECGQVSMETIDEAIRRVLSVKERLNLFENPYVIHKEYNIEDHRITARKIEEEAIVLLKNDGTLPLSKDTKLCIMGDLLNDKRNPLGSWAVDHDINETVTVAEGIMNKCETAFVSEYPLGIDYDITLECDVVAVVLGESYKYTGEYATISKIEIDERQKLIINRAKKTGKKIVGIMEFGRPRALEEVIDLFDAVIYAWHGGSQVGNAVANIIFGDVSPSGKLPMTLPRTTGQIPIYYNCPPSGRDTDGYYGKSLLVNYWDKDGTPLFPFGFGLSYAQFKYGEITCNKKAISLEDIENGECFNIDINVKNTSDIVAKETVQCYIRDCFSSYTRPIKELKAFEKQEFNKNETKTISFKIGKKELGYYMPNGDFVVEKGEFKIYVGTDCLTKDYISVEVV